MSFFEEVIYILNYYGMFFLQGMLSTLVLAIVGTIVGLILGMGLALLRNLKTTKRDSLITKIFKRLGSIFALTYIEIFRGTPMMVQAMIIYFGGKGIGIQWDIFACGLFVISINTAAYMAEIVRSGINSVDKGQIEAARALGFSHFKTMSSIVFPQALRNSIPTIGNEFVVNIKDSSVLNVISVTELYVSASIAYGLTYMQIPCYFIIAVIYLILTRTSSIILKQVEKKLSFRNTKKIKHPISSKVENANNG